MLLSSDELEILEYLKSFSGKWIAMIEICRCAGGRKKFKESPNWAKSLMARLVDAGQVVVNERGHYRWIDPATAPAPGMPAFLPIKAPSAPKAAVIVGDDYFPSDTNASETEATRWVSPQIAEILKRSGKKFNGPK